MSKYAKGPIALAPVEQPCSGGMQQHLGLYDTPPDRRRVRFGLVVASLPLIAFPLILPVRDIRMAHLDAFVPTIDGIMFVGEMITATLLYAQAILFRSRAMIVLATGYVLAALLLVSHALTFPGAFAPDGLLGGGLNSTAWIGTIRRAMCPIAVILYIVLRREDSAAETTTERPIPSVLLALIVAIALAVAFTVLATTGHDLLPTFYSSRTDVLYSNAVKVESVVFAMCLGAGAMLFLTRKSVLDMWLLVAFSGWLIQSALIMLLHGRFTAGWYCLFFMTLFSHLVVLVALLAESNRLYARLALSTSAQNRERDARLMSMDAVAAAISHEAGQPLTAAMTNAMAGLHWLTETRPNIGKTLQAIRATIDDVRRTHDVMKSTRAMFAQGRGSVSQFNLNDLIRDSAAILDRELAVHKVSLELALDDALPPVVADRVQMQRVFINILSNAMDSLEGTRNRPRSIEIRSSAKNGRDVLVEIHDTGNGIAPDHMANIFDAFFTTKTTGTGLGLSLCRTIVEEHSGKLWASAGDEYGATFHLQLRAAVGST